MSIVDGKGLVTWEGGLFEPGSDLLRRVQWAFAEIRRLGGHISLNEAGRPFGTPSDQYARSASDTESGRSTVWFQWGRYLRGETPSAADPRQGVYASEHTRGIAIDCNAPTVFDMTLRARVFAQVGLVNTISSESWHWAIRGNPSVDLGGYGNATAIEEEDMSPEQAASLAEIQSAVVAIKDAQIPALSQRLAAVEEAVGPINRTPDRPTVGEDGLFPLKQEVADTKTAVLGIQDALKAIKDKLGI